jgi:hypothetical protein
MYAPIANNPRRLDIVHRRLTRAPAFGPLRHRQPARGAPRQRMPARSSSAFRLPPFSPQCGMHPAMTSSAVKWTIRARGSSSVVTRSIRPAAAHCSTSSLMDCFDAASDRRGSRPKGRRRISQIPSSFLWCESQHDIKGQISAAPADETCN